MCTAVRANPFVEKWEKGENPYEKAAECTNMEEHACGVGWNMQVGRFLVLWEHGCRIGIKDAFSGISTLF